MSDAFDGRYEVDDGYAGGSRPQHFRVYATDLDDEMTDEELVAFYEEVADDCFRQNIGITLRREAEFVSWARGVLNARKAEEA